MSFLASDWIHPIGRRDRIVLLVCGLLVVILILMVAFFSPPREGEEDFTPSSYSTGKHGAKAAYELLRKSGYNVDRQNAPLADVVDHVDDHTTVVIAEPYMQDLLDARAAVKEILNRGGRVLITGASGAMLLPGNGLERGQSSARAECDAEPNGFGQLANSGKVRIRAPVSWRPTNPLQRVEYTCGGRAVVVTYSVGKGTVIWWASSFPLENIGIQRDDNLALFLNSIGPQSTHVIWDESLHGEFRSLWSYADGTPIQLIWGQLALVAVLLLLSYSRRSGPLRPDPIVSRAAPIEFVRSLGSLYQKAGANSTAVAIAYHRFRYKLEKQFAIRQTLAADDPALLEVLTSRFGERAAPIQGDLIACENAAGEEKIPSREALALVQAVHDDAISMERRSIADRAV
jgi:Domain of unknown function (DUF4350)